MILDELSFLQETIKGIRTDCKFLDNDAEVELIFNSSPPFFHQISTYELESLFRTENVEMKKIVEAEAIVSEVPLDAYADDNEADQDETDKVDELKIKFLTPCREEEMFQVQNPGITAAYGSALTRHLVSPQFNPQLGSIKLTIYLPDCTPMIVYVQETSTYEQVISKVIQTHQAKNLQPPLRNDNAADYELYLNEGDGVPDRDFVFRKTQKIADNKVDEYCLCEADEDEDHPAPVTTSYSVGNRHSMMRFDSIGSGSSIPLAQPNTVTVVIPTSRGDSLTVRLNYDDSTTLKQLLVDIADKKKHKIRLYTDEFSFMVSSEDQARLKLMSPHVDLNSLVSTFGDNCKFELQKRAFEDSPRDLSKLKFLPSKNLRAGDDNSDSNAVVFNETTAVMLQQWNIIKKNKLGSRQERIIGIDGKYIYNSKRDQRPGTGVKVPYRDISLLQSIEVLEDKLTFRINWKEDKVPGYSIEYMCQNERDCAEIKAKVKFLISQQVSRKRGTTRGSGFV